MHLFFIRHAQPAWLVDGAGVTDPGLTPVGARQAGLLADRITSTLPGVTDVVVSSARRCRETAEPLVRRLGIEPTVLPDLREMRIADLEGAPAAAVEEYFRHVYERPPEEWWTGMPGGEGFRGFHDRITTATADLLAARGVVPHGGHLESHLWSVADDDRTVLVVAHAGTNAIAVGFLLGLEPAPWEWERLVLGHASIAGLGTFPLGGAHIFSLRSFNDQEHLPADLRTR